MAHLRHTALWKGSMDVAGGVRLAFSCRNGVARLKSRSEAIHFPIHEHVRTHRSSDIPSSTPCSSHALPPYACDDFRFVLNAKILSEWLLASVAGTPLETGSAPGAPK